jgi:hypothetical protein
MIGFGKANEIGKFDLVEEENEMWRRLLQILNEDPEAAGLLQGSSA